MDKDTAIEMIDQIKGSMINPVEMLNWIWLRMIIKEIPQEQWDIYLANVAGKME